MVKIIPFSRIHFFQNMDPKGMVRIYSYQHPEAVRLMFERGYLTGNHDYAWGADEKEKNYGFYQAYNWMREQMQARVSNFSGDYPVWAWLKRPCSRPGRRGAHYPNWATVRITAFVPRERILLSDYDMYNVILNGQRVALTEEEFNYEEEIGDTWVRIFDLTPRTGKSREWMGGVSLVQACVDRIYTHEVVHVRDFALKKGKSPSPL